VDKSYPGGVGKWGKFGVKSDPKTSKKGFKKGLFSMI